MKKYIILTPEIGNMGGSQMFVCNKSEYLRASGWNVTICYFTESPILIKQFQSINTVFCPELAWGIQHYTKISVSKIIDKLVNILHCTQKDEIIVESLLCQLAFWGELLSMRVNAKHIINQLEEDIPQYNSEEIKFFDFKLKRRECINASEQSLRRLFKSYYNDGYSQYFHSTSFFCSNVTDDIEFNDEVLPSSDTFNILSIGRLDKPYIRIIIEDIVCFSKQHTEVRFGLIMVGASPDGIIETEIQNKLRSIKNIQLYLLGYLFPIPTKVVKSANVAIATSNSVKVSYELQIPTISIDANDNHAIGVYMYNTKNTVFRTEEEKVPVDFYLEKLFKKEIVNDMIDYSQSATCIDRFADQMLFTRRESFDIIYYNVQSIYGCIETLIGLLKRNIFRLIHMF